jgi:RNA polymerase sigma-70 factor, ECF subfamily
LRHALLVADSEPPRIIRFAGRGDMRRWVRVMAVRDALALTRASRRVTGDEALEDAVATDDNPEVQYLKRRYRDEFATAFGQAVERLSHRDRLLLRQHFLDGVTVGRLAELHRVHRATATRWLDDARTAVLTATREILMARLDVAPAELDSIMRLIGSQLAVNPRVLYARRKP